MESQHVCECAQNKHQTRHFLISIHSLENILRMFVYYKNINVSTTNHFTLVDKAIYTLTHIHTHQSKEGEQDVKQYCFSKHLLQQSKI